MKDKVIILFCAFLGVEKILGERIKIGKKVANSWKVHSESDHPNENLTWRNKKMWPNRWSPPLREQEEETVCGEWIQK